MCFFLFRFFGLARGGPRARELCSQFFLAFTNFRKFSMTKKYLLLSRLPRIIHHFPMSHVVGHMVGHCQHPGPAPYNFTEGMGANSAPSPGHHTEDLHERTILEANEREANISLSLKIFKVEGDKKKLGPPVLVEGTPLRHQKKSKHENRCLDHPVAHSDRS